MRRAERDRGGEIIDRLRHDARPVDGIDAGEPHPVAEGVVIEHRLHQRLAVVEGAVDGDRVHVGVGRRGHHAPLHLGDAAVGEQHHHVDLGAAAEGLDRGAAGIAGCGDHDGGALAALDQHVVHQPGDELHRQVLEGERRPVEQLEHEQAGAELGRAASPPDGGRCRRPPAPCGRGRRRRCRRRRRAAAPRPPPRRRAGRRSPRSGRAPAPATPRARKGRRRGPDPRASPRRNRAGRPRPGLRHNALIRLYFPLPAGPNFAGTVAAGRGFHKESRRAQLRPARAPAGRRRSGSAPAFPAADRPPSRRS